MAAFAFKDRRIVTKSDGATSTIRNKELIQKKKDLLQSIFALPATTSDQEINNEFDRHTASLGLQTRMDFTQYALENSTSFDAPIRFDLPARIDINEAYVSKALEFISVTATPAQFEQQQARIANYVNWCKLITACAVLRHPNPPNSISVLLLTDAIDDLDQAQKYYSHRSEGKEIHTELNALKTMLKPMQEPGYAGQKIYYGFKTQDQMTDFEATFSKLHSMYLEQNSAVKELLYASFCSLFVYLLEQDHLQSKQHLYLPHFQAVLANHKLQPGTQVRYTLVGPLFFDKSRQKPPPAKGISTTEAKETQPLLKGTNNSGQNAAVEDGSRNPDNRCCCRIC